MTVNIGSVEGAISLRDDFSVKFGRVARNVESSLGDLEKKLARLSGPAAGQGRASASQSAKLLSSLRAETRALEENIAAARKGPAAFAALNREREVMTRLVQAGVSRESAYGRQIEQQIRLQQRHSETLNKLDTSLTSVGSRMTSMGNGLADVGARMSFAVTVPLTLAGRAVINAASNFESSFTGIRKTVDASEPELAALATGMRNLAKEIPVAVDELNSIGESAGQLGVQTKNIEGFTRTVAAMGVATNLSTDAAATGLARLANITGTSQDKYSNLGSSIVDLGNKFATTEAEILEFGLRIAGAGRIAGVSEGKLLGIGAAISSVGVEAEAGGTAIQKVLLNMTQAVTDGGETLKIFADTARMTVQEFKALFEKDAGAAFERFVLGLGKQGKAAFKTLEALKLEDQRLIRSFISVANAGDLLSRAMKVGSEAFDENKALAAEAARRYETFASKLQVFKNKINDAAITLGQSLLPVLSDAIRLSEPILHWLAGMAAKFSKLPDPVKAVALAFGALLAAAGPVLFIGGNLLTIFGQLSAAAPVLATRLAAISPVLTAVSLAAVGLAQGFKTASESMQRDIDKMVEKSAKLGEAFKIFKKIQLESASGGGTVFITAEEQGAVEAHVQSLREKAKEAAAEIAKIQGSIVSGALNSAQVKIAEQSIASLQARMSDATREADKYDSALAKTGHLATVVASATEDLGDDVASTSSGIGELSDKIKDLLAELETETKGLAFFSTQLDLTKRNFEESTLRADAFKRVSAAGISPLEGLGKTLYDTALANARYTAALKKAEEQHEEYKDSVKKIGDALEDVFTNRLALAENKASDIARGVLEGMKSLRELRLAAGDMNAYAAAVKKGAAELRKFNVEMRVKQFMRDLGSEGRTAEELERIYVEVTRLFSSIDEAEHEAEAYASRWSAISDTVGSISTILGDSNSQLSEMVSKVVEIAEGWERAKKAQAEGDASGQAAAYASMAASFSSLGESMGWWGQKGGQGGFGPKESNYANQGAAIGTVIGSVIGGIIGAAAGGIGAVPGAQIGGALGGAIGKMIGSMIHHGAPEAKAQIQLEAGKLATNVYRDEGGLGDIISEIGAKMVNGLDQVLSALGAELESIPTVKLKVRGDHVSVIVGAVYAKFKSVDEAISFAVSQILRQGEIAGNISSNVKAALQNSLAQSMEELMSDIDFAIELDRAGMAEVEIAVQDYLMQYRAAIERATQLGLDTSKVGMQLGGNLQQLRDSILGVQVDPKEKIRRDAELFNLQIQITKAEQSARLVDLQQKRANLIASVSIVRADNAVGQAHLQARAKMVDAERSLVNAEFGIVNEMIDALAAVDAAILATETLLNNLPDLINDLDIARAIRGVGGGGGTGEEPTAAATGGVSNWHQRTLSALESIRQLQSRLVLGELSPYTGAERVDIARAEIDRLMEQYNRGGRARIKAMEEIGSGGMFEQYLQLFQNVRGTTGEYGAEFEELNTFLSQILSGNGIAPVANIAQATADADAFARSFQYDSRGSLRTRDEDLERQITEGNRFAERTSHSLSRVVELLEEQGVNFGAGGVGGGVSARPSRNAPSGPVPTKSFYRGAMAG